MKIHYRECATAAKSILLKDFKQNIMIADLALRLGTSERNLKRAFAYEFKMGIHELLTEIRMEKAKEYLMEGDKQVKEIARLVGYKKPSSFSKKFAEIHCISPTQWQKENFEMVV